MRARRVEAEGRHAPRGLAVVEPVAFEVFEQVAREAQLRGADCAATRQLEAERGLAVMEDEPVVLAERRAVAGGFREAAAAERELERPVERGVAAGVALARGRGRRSSTRASEQPRWPLTIASSAGTPRPSSTASASRSFTSSARVSRSSCSLASRVVAPFVIATKGTSYGTLTTGKPSLFASSTSADGTSEKPKPSPKPSPESPCFARRRRYERWAVASSPTPRPVVSRNSPPSRNGGRVVELGDVEPRHLVGQTVRARRDAQA